MSPSYVVDAYPDMLEDPADPGLEKLLLDLSNFYQVASAPFALKASLEAALLESANARRHLAPGRVKAPRLRFSASAVLAAVAVLALVSIVGYAVAPLVDQLLATERGTSSLAMQNIGQSKTSNGVTVTLDRAYADVNRIIVLYTIQVPADFANSTSGIDGKIRLADVHGLTFQLIAGQGLDGKTPHVSAGLVTFDSESVAPGTAAVDLQLSLPDVRARAEKPGEPDLAAGAFAFSFSMPVAPGHVITANKTAVTRGVAVTLDRVVVTPSEARAYLRFPAGDGFSASDWNADVHISGAGWDSRRLPAGFSGEMTTGSMFMNTSGEHVTTLSGDFTGRHGEWTITVDELEAVDTATPPIGGQLPHQARIQGPWSFRLSSG